VVKPNPVGVHPQLSHNKLLVGGALVAVGSLWPCRAWMTPYLELCHFLLKPSSPPFFSDLCAKINLEIFKSIELKFIYVNFLNILY